MLHSARQPIRMVQRHSESAIKNLTSAFFLRDSKLNIGRFRCSWCDEQNPFECSLHTAGIVLVHCTTIWFNNNWLLNSCGLLHNSHLSVCECENRIQGDQTRFVSDLTGRHELWHPFPMSKTRQIGTPLADHLCLAHAIANVPCSIHLKFTEQKCKGAVNLQVPLTL